MFSIFRQICNVYVKTHTHWKEIQDHTQWWTGLTPSPVLRNHSWRYSEDPVYCLRSDYGQQPARQAPCLWLGAFFFLNELQFMKNINIDCLVFKMGMQCIYSENSLHTLMVGHLKVKHLTVILSSPLPRLCLNYYSLVYVKCKFFLYSCLYLKYNSD